MRGVSRSGRSEAPDGAEIVAGDAADADAARRLAEDAETVYACIGLPYPEWREGWPGPGGPGAGVGLLRSAGEEGERVFPAALEGRPAQLLPDVDQPHTYTYVLDFARALARLGNDERSLGHIWHVPNAPARTTREVVETIYRLAGSEPRMKVMAPWQLRLLALVSPLMRELKEMDFQRDRPYLVEDQRARETFGLVHTEREEGLRATLDWYRQQSRSSS